MISLSRAAVALLASVALAGCGSAAPPSATVPNVVGQALDAAKSTLVTAGFPADSQDLLRDRNPLLDSDWTVCTQTPGPVAAAVAGTTVDLGVVKQAETCPDAGTAAAPSSATRTRSAAVPTTPAARPAPTSKPQPAQPIRSNGAGSAGSGSSGSGSGGGGASSGGAAGGAGVAAGAAVRSGAFCDPPATGVSDRGTAMVCAPATDGRNRWKRT
jgi:beta-lactam-binding protein with PASTA domain